MRIVSILRSIRPEESGRMGPELQLHRPAGQRPAVQIECARIGDFMEHASQVLWSALRKVSRPERPLDLLRAMWPVLVGQRLAAHTRPVNWHKGRVDIEVTDPEWHRQLTHLKDDIRKQINRWWGTELVHEVKLIEVRAKKEPGRASGKKSKRRVVADAEENSLLTSSAPSATRKFQEKLHKLEAVLESVSDVELRELIAQVAQKYLAGGEKK